MEGSAKPLFLVVLLLAAGVVVFAALMLSGSDPGTDAGAGTRSGVETAVAERPQDILPPPAIPTGPERRAPERTAVAPSGGDVAGYANAVLGTVKDENGAPVDGAIVHARVGTGNPIFVMLGGTLPEGPAYETRTDAKGSYRIAHLVPDENYELRVSHANYAPATRTNVLVLAEGETPHDFVLQKGFVLAGTVFDRQSSPIANVRLVLENAAVGPFAPESMRDPRVATSDESGAFQFENLPDGPRNLTATAPGYGGKTIPNIQFVGDTKIQTREIFLTPGLAITGIVVDEAGAGVPRASVEATAYSSQEISKGTAEANADGVFVIDGLTEGPFSLVATAPGYSRETLPRVEPGAEGIRVELSRLGVVQGRVFDRASGRPIANFRLEARKVTQPGAYGRHPAQEEFRNAKEGQFSFAGLEPGSYALLARAAGYAQAYSAEFVVVKGAPTQGIEIGLGAGGSISGRLVDAKTGRGVTGATLRTRDNTFEDNPFIQIFAPLLVTNVSEVTARSGEDGAFRLERLMPGTYQLEIDHGRYTKKSLRGLAVEEGVASEAGEVQMTTGATVQGVAFEGSGVPIAGGQVMLRPTSPQPGLTQRQTRTDSQGRFLLRSVPPGDYEISVTKTDGQPNPFEMILHIQKSKQPVTLLEGEEREIHLHLGGT